MNEAHECCFASTTICADCRDPESAPVMICVSVGSRGGSYDVGEAPDYQLVCRECRSFWNPMTVKLCDCGAEQAMPDPDLPSVVECILHSIHELRVCQLAALQRENEFLDVMIKRVKQMTKAAEVKPWQSD